MTVQWKTFFVKLIIWLVAEILLTILGVDDLADYSEFLFEKNAIVFISGY